MLTYFFDLQNLLNMSLEIEEKDMFVINESKRRLIGFSKQAIGSNKIQLRYTLLKIYFCLNHHFFIKKTLCYKMCFELPRL